MDDNIQPKKKREPKRFKSALDIEVDVIKLRRKQTELKHKAAQIEELIKKFRTDAEDPKLRPNEQEWFKEQIHELKVKLKKTFRSIDVIDENRIPRLVRTAAVLGTKTMPFLEGKDIKLQE